MFLSMLTADAAAQHGHEFSSPRPHAAARRLPITRSPLSILPSARQRPLPGPSPLGPGKRVLKPKRSRSLRITMAELREELEAEPDEDDDDHISRLRIPGAFHTTLTQSRSLLDLHTTVKIRPPPKQPFEAPAALPSPARVSFNDPLPSVPPPRRTPRPKTQYRLAHPPPVAKSKQINKHLRPRVLLQLQQQNASGFHRPVYEVVPGSRFASHTKIGQKLNKLHKLRERQLAPDDLVVVQVEDSKMSDTSSEDSESVEGRTVLGIICPSACQEGRRPDCALICLDTACWKASADKDGRYDFVLQGDESQKARWYIPKRKRSSHPAQKDATEDKKFYFAPMQPNTTKHPTVAALNPTHLDVYDSYSPLGTPTDDSLRKVILVSAAWVFFREGWSPYFDYALSPGLSAPTCPQGLHQRSTSMPTETAECRPESTNPLVKLVRIRSKRPNLSRCNSNSLTPSAASSERAPSPAQLPVSLQSPGVLSHVGLLDGPADESNSLADPLATTVICSNPSAQSPLSPQPPGILSPAGLTGGTRECSDNSVNPPLICPTRCEKTAQSLALPQTPGTPPPSELTEDTSDDSDSPVNSSYWRDFDKLVIRTAQQRPVQQRMDRRAERLDLVDRDLERSNTESTMDQTKAEPSETSALVEPHGVRLRFQRFCSKLKARREQRDAGARVKREAKSK